MTFKAERQVEIPPKDVLSYIFDHPNYDQDKPVSFFQPPLNTQGK
jgi:hypothetical protein